MTLFGVALGEVGAGGGQHLEVVQEVGVDERLEERLLERGPAELAGEDERQLVVAAAEVLAEDAEARGPSRAGCLAAFLGMIRRALHRPHGVRVVEVLLALSELLHVGDHGQELLVVLDLVGPALELGRPSTSATGPRRRLFLAELLFDLAQHAAEGLVSGDDPAGVHLDVHPLLPDLFFVLGEVVAASRRTGVP